MSFPKMYICCLLLLMTCIAAKGQTNLNTADSLRIETIGVKDGLSQGLVSCTLQDKDGFMWFGTKDGLNKYDGYHFTIYRYEKDNPYSLPGNYITNIVEDDNGNFWVGTTTAGLCLFDRKKERFYPVHLPDYNPNIAEKKIIPLKYQKGQLLISGEKLRIYNVRRIRPGHYDHVALSDAEVCLDDVNTVGEIKKPASSLFYLAHWLNDQSMWIIKNDSISIYRPDPSGKYKKANAYGIKALGIQSEESFTIIELDQPNRYLFVGNKDLTVYDFGKMTMICQKIFNDGYPNGRKVSREKYGKFYINQQENHFTFNSNDCSLEYGKGIMIGTLDRTGIMWMCSSGLGVRKMDYRKQLFRHVPHYSFYQFNLNGEILITMSNKEIGLLNPYTLKSRTILPKGIWQKQWEIQTYLKDKEGTEWVAFYSDKNTYNLLSYHSASGRLIKKELADTNYLYPALFFTDRNDDLWMCTYDTKKNVVLARFNHQTLSIEEKFVFPAKTPNRESEFITDNWQDARGVFWFSTYQGLFSLNPKNQQWQHWQNMPGNAISLSSNQLLSILPDPKKPDQYLWLGTEGAGIDCFEIATGKCIHYTEKDGLPNNVAYGLLSDKAGNIWISTNRGLSCFAPSLPKGEGRFRNFSSEDGLPGDEFNRYEYFKLPNGDLLFGGVEGGVIFNPEKVLEKEPPPPVMFTGLSVFNKPVDYKSDSNIISLPIAYASVITLPHDKGMFTISFAALEYTPANKKKYRYYLDGYDKQWIDGGSKNEATYTNLSPGTYTFHVTACGRDGVWNEQGKTIDIVILPAWYQTIWFKVLVLLLIAGGLYGWYRYRLAQEIKVLNIRNQIAHDLHDEIGSTLSSISISSSVIQRKVKGSNEEAYNMLKQISNNTDNMMESMSDIVWTISTRNDSFESLVNRMRAFAIEILDPYDILFHLDVNEPTKNISLNMVQRKNLYLIFKEAINNAAKYAACKKVYVTLISEGKKLHMTIQDDGCGMDITKRDLEVKGKSMGGNGLYAMHKRANEIKGKLSIESVIGNGTKVSIAFPL